MLLQTNSYIVPKDKRAEHSRLIRRFRQTLLRLGCDHFEVYEQVGSNWSNSESAGRYVQILRFLDRKHQLAVQAAERSDPTAQAVIADFCDLINFPYQQQQGLFAVGFYTSVLPVAPKRGARGELVSTVEHEVIDDPEAEKPYPGASDGPPLEEGATEGMVEQPLDEASELPEEEPMPEAEADDELLSADEPTAADELLTPEPIRGTTLEDDEIEEPSFDDEETPDEIVAEPLAHPSEAREISPSPIAEISPPAAHTAADSEADDDFMKLVGGDLDEEDDSANGFIETDFVEEIAGIKPGTESVDPHKSE
jgi:hypothetical protein